MPNWLGVEVPPGLLASEVMPVDEGPIKLRCLILWDPEPGPAGSLPGLKDGLAAELREALMLLLIERAKRWCLTISPEPPLLVSEAELSAAALGAEAVLIVRPTMARLGKSHAEDIRGDLAHGCGVIFGATLGGGWYLLTMSPVRQDLLDAAGNGTDGTAGDLLAAATKGADLEAGMLRAERNLETLDDLAAARVDPMTPEDIAALIRI